MRVYSEKTILIFTVTNRNTFKFRKIENYWRGSIRTVKKDLIMFEGYGAGVTSYLCVTKQKPADFSAGFSVALAIHRLVKS